MQLVVHRATYSIITVLTGVALLLLSGCGVFFPMAAGAAMQSDSMQSFLKQPGQQALPAGQQGTGGAAMANRDTMDSSDVIANTVPEIRWIDPGNTGAGQGVPSGGLARAVATGALHGAVAPMVVSPGATTRPAGNGTASALPPGLAAALNRPPAAFDRQAVLNQLRQMIRDSNDPAMTKALSAVALTQADPSAKLDPADLAALDPSRRQLVLGYYQLLAHLNDQATGSVHAGAASAAGGPDAGVTADAAGGAQPIEIRTVQLCRRVRGFGSYDPFESSSFLAGRDQKIWVYVELDHFRSVKNAKGLFEVRLAQSLSLYHDSDGLEVWKQPEAEIPDESRNQRRDFFVVEPITLPARLSVGKYLLKVRIIDRHGDSVAEMSTPIQIVADPALLANGS